MRTNVFHVPCVHIIQTILKSNQGETSALSLALLDFCECFTDRYGDFREFQIFPLFDFFSGPPVCFIYITFFSFIIHPCDPTLVLIWLCDMEDHITHLVSHSSSLL